MDQVKNISDENCMNRLINVLRISDTPKTPGDLARETTSTDTTICTYLNMFYNGNIVDFSDDGDGYRRYLITEFGKKNTNDEIKEIIKTKIKARVKGYRCCKRSKNSYIYHIIMLLKKIRDVKKDGHVYIDDIKNKKDYDIPDAVILCTLTLLRKTGYIKNIYRGCYKFTELLDNDIEKIIDDIWRYKYEYVKN